MEVPKIIVAVAPEMRSRQFFVQLVTFESLYGSGVLLVLTVST